MASVLARKTAPIIGVATKQPYTSFGMKEKSISTASTFAAEGITLGSGINHYEHTPYYPGVYMDASKLCETAKSQQYILRSEQKAKKSLCRNIVSTIGAGKEGKRKSKMEGILVSKKITLEDIVTCKEDFLYPNDVAKVLNSDPQTIRTQAHQDPDKLGFPVCVCGNRTIIPRLAFLKWCGVETKQLGDGEVKN